MDLWKSIEQAYYAEEQDGRRAVDASDIPFSYEAITAEWLTNVLGKTYPDVRVSAFDLDAGDDGTSNRRRIHLQYDHEGGCEAPPSSNASPQRSTTSKP
jgi:hypothetical protein